MSKSIPTVRRWRVSAVNVETGKVRASVEVDAPNQQFARWAATVQGVRVLPGEYSRVVRIRE